MFKNKNGFLLLIVFSASSLCGTGTIHNESKKSHTIFTHLKNGSFITIGLASTVILATSMFGFTENCKKLMAAYFSPIQEGDAQIPLDCTTPGDSWAMWEEVNVQEQAKNVGLRSALIVMSSALCYYCYSTIFK